MSSSVTMTGVCTNSVGGSNQRTSDVGLAGDVSAGTDVPLSFGLVGASCGNVGTEGCTALGKTGTDAAGIALGSTEITAGDVRLAQLLKLSVSLMES